MENIEHEYTDEITCPHCGCEHFDSWEVQSNEGNFKCNDCNKDFFFERNIEITYSTSIIELESTEN